MKLVTKLQAIVIVAFQIRIDIYFQINVLVNNIIMKMEIQYALIVIIHGKITLKLNTKNSQNCTGGNDDNCDTCNTNRSKNYENKCLCNTRYYEVSMTC